MSTGLILAIDQGTSGTKALVVDGEGAIVTVAEVPVHPRAVGDVGVEQDPDELWDSVLSAARKAIAETGPVDALALSNQGETVLAWDPHTGRPLSPAIVWQDRRAQSVCDRLHEHAAQVKETTGLRLDSYFAAPKMSWLREQGYSGGVTTTTDVWLLNKLTGRFVTDAATASRTALLDLDSCDYSQAMSALFEVDDESLPEIVDCAAVLGTTRLLGGEVPVAGACVDQQAALFAEGCHHAGQAKCTYGTGAFLLANTDRIAVRSRAGLVGCVAWRLDGNVSYCLDGQVYTAGSAIGWLTELGVISEPADIDRYASGRRVGPETFVPALAGLAAPYWAPTARAALAGLTLSSDRGAVVRAVIEGVAAGVTMLAAAVSEDLGELITILRVDGGLTRSRALLQAQADLLQTPVEVYGTPHATALGVAAFARLGVGLATNPAAAIAFKQAGSTVTVEPRCSEQEARERLEVWGRAVDAVLESARREVAGE